MSTDLLIDPEVRQQRRQRRRLFKIGGAIVLVLVLVLVIARPTRHAIKSWQARRHAEKAMILIDQEQWKEGSDEARAAYQLRPGEPAAIRAVARLLTRTGQAEALGFWKALHEIQPLTRQDLRDETAAALATGEVSTAATAVKALMDKSEGGPGPADQLLAAQVAAQLGQPADAAGHLDKITSDPKASERLQLQASLLQLALNAGESPAMKEAQTAAWTRLTKIARGQSATALDALTILTQRSLSRPNEIVLDPAIMPDAEIVHALEVHPLSKTSQKLLALDLQMHDDPEQRAPLIDQAIATWKTADNESLATLGRWLNGKGEFQKELDTIPLERALQTRDLFLQRLDALGSLDQWAEIQRLLTEESFPLDPVIERMYLARCNQQLGEVIAGQNNWQRALEAAQNDPQKLLILADYAEKNGATKIAETAYNIVARDTPHTRAAQQGRLRLAQPTRNTRKIHTILAEMLQQWPNDTAIQNDEAYTRLLLLPGGTTSVSSESGDSAQANPSLGAAKSEIRNPKSENAAPPAITDNKEPGIATSSPPIRQGTDSPWRITNNQELITIEQLAELLVAHEPASLPHRTLLALVRLKLGQPAQALAVYDQLRIPPNAATPSAVAVHAAVLAASGREEDARTEAGAVNWEQLLPEEQGLIRDLRP